MPTPNSAARYSLEVGTVIADTYRVDALIGRGGMGAVFVASHLRLPGNQVAIKVLHTGVDDAEVIARFRREAEIASRLRHPNIVGVIDQNELPDGTPYQVLEFLRGVSLADRIAQGPLPIEHIVRIVRHVGSALAAAHREGIVHRDLKPQNIFLIAPEGENTIEVAKVLDFGISKIRGSQTVKTQDNALLGTPQYMAPEQATGKHDSLDERTDLFALGAIVYEMVSGKPAFSGASIPEVVFKVVYEPTAPLPDSVPADVAAAITRAMAKSPDERFSTVDAFVEALTGTKLSRGRVTIDPPAQPDQFAAGSKHTVAQGGAEHASTLASGDHGSAATFGIAETVDSAKLPASVAPIAEGAATVSTLAPSGSQVMAVANTKVSGVATDSRSIWGRVLAAGGAIAAAAIALLLFVNLRSTDRANEQPTSTAHNVVGEGSEPLRPSEPAQGTKQQSADTPAQATSEPTAPAPPTQPTAGVGRASPTAAGKVPKPPKPPKSTTPRLVISDDREDAAELAGARAAYRAGDVASAVRQANAVINSAPAKSRARGQALFLRGKVRCELEHLAETGRRDVRMLEDAGFDNLAKRLEKICSN